MVRISRILILVACCLFLAKPALATTVYTYSPKGPITLRAAPGDTVTQVIAIKNEKPYSPSVNVQLNKGGSCFSMNVSNYYINLYKDSTFSLVVRYVPTPGDTSHAWLRIYDSLTVPDTVFFTGMDSTQPYLGPDWSIVQGDYRLGSYYNKPDSTFIEIQNFLNESVTISASLANGSRGIVGFGSQTKTIAAKQSTRFGYRFLSSEFDTAFAVVQFTGGGISDEVTLNGQNWMPQADSLWLLTAINYGTADPGDTICESFMIRNFNGAAATITEITDPVYAKHFYLSGKPALPLLLQPGDSLMFSVCFVAPQTADSIAYGAFSITYHLAGQSSRTDWVMLNGQTTRCFDAQNALDFGSVVRGSTSVRTFRVTNYRNYDVDINSVSAEVQSNKFALLTQLPLTIPAASYVDLEVQLTAEGYIYPYERYTLHSDALCGTSTVFVTAHIDDSLLVDSIATPLFANELRTLLFTGDSSHLERTFSFYNDLTDAIKVISVGLKQGEHFNIASIAPHEPELTLDSSDVMQVTIDFTGDPGNYNDTLVIVTEDGILALNFAILASIEGTSSVAEVNPSHPSVSVTPNPAQGPVTIDVTNAQQFDVVILDILGHKIADHSSPSVWQTSALANGTYFVRASGVGNDGKPFVSTARLIIQ